MSSVHAGKEIFMPFANGGAKSVLTYAHSAKTRKTMFLGDDKKLVENLSILDEIVRKRYSRAKNLGYANRSALIAERQLAKTPEWVEDFLLTVKDGLVPLGKKEIEELQHRRLMDTKEKQGGTTDLGPKVETEASYSDLISPWDLFYYQNIIEREFDVDHATISEYYPVELTATPMLGVFASLLGIRFDRIRDIDNINVWHDSVQVFSVWDETGADAELMGYLYFDLLWRENKFRGSHNVTPGAGLLETR
jgi:metallopeptidase MepB